jgi:hypothetical protein
VRLAGPDQFEQIGVEPGALAGGLVNHDGGQALLHDCALAAAGSLQVTGSPVFKGRPWDRLDLLSVYGTLQLTGAMAATRGGNRAVVDAFLDHAENASRRLGGDANRVWTSFGPTNVQIHRVATAAELGDMQVAVDLVPRVDASPLPVERQVRHRLEVTRALSAWNHRDAALAKVLEAKRLAPEQVRYHFLSRQLVLHWVRSQRSRPSYALRELAHRLHVV